MKRQDERLGAVCARLEAETHGDTSLDASHPTNISGIPGISSFMIANQERFDELCDYIDV